MVGRSGSTLMKLIKKGIALGNQGKYDEAIKCFNDAIRLDPKNVDAWNNKGVTLVIQGKYDEALKAFDEAIRIDPNLVGAWNNKGVVLDALGRTAEANAAKAKAKDLGYNG
jgi:Flp pilus assembly protein TadD